MMAACKRKPSPAAMPSSPNRATRAALNSPPNISGGQLMKRDASDAIGAGCPVLLAPGPVSLLLCLAAFSRLAGGGFGGAELSGAVLSARTTGGVAGALGAAFPDAGGCSCGLLSELAAC